MCYHAIDVAKYIISYSNRKNKPVSNLKLQKIMYFAWIDFYKQTNRMLFDDYICAWLFGPVVPDVYYKFCTYAGTPIIQDYNIELDADDASILDKIIDTYLDVPASTLVSKSHAQGGAWDKTFHNGEGKRAVIKFDLIKELECDS